jgi:hypothetical protein
MFIIIIVSYSNERHTVNHLQQPNNYYYVHSVNPSIPGGS